MSNVYVLKSNDRGLIGVYSSLNKIVQAIKSRQKNAVAEIYALNTESDEVAYRHIALNLKNLKYQLKDSNIAFVDMKYFDGESDEYQVLREEVL